MFLLSNNNICIATLVFDQRLISTKEALELEVCYLNRGVLSTLNFSKTKYELNFI